MKMFGKIRKGGREEEGVAVKGSRGSTDGKVFASFEGDDRDAS